MSPAASSARSRARVDVQRATKRLPSPLASLTIAKMIPETQRAREICIAELARLEAFARRCANDGPEYGDDDAPYAFWTAAEVLRSHAPEPNESAAAYFARAEHAARERLASIECPASHEALNVIAAAGGRLANPKPAHDAACSTPRPSNGREVFRAFEALAHDAQVDALVVACEPALARWNAWAGVEAPRYVDSVVGMEHSVDLELPGRALAEVRARKQSPSTSEDYLEPITALQDDDLDMPSPLELAYYAIYNLHQLVFTPGDGVTPALVLNQAISATLHTSDEAEIDARLLEWWESSCKSRI